MAQIINRFGHYLFSIIRNDSSVRAMSIELHLVLESDDVVRILHSKHIVEQFEPERLALTLLVSTVLPLLSKRLCRYLLLAILHDGMI